MDILEGHIHHGVLVIRFDMTSEGCVSALGLRDELITAAFARNFGLRFR